MLDIKFIRENSDIIKKGIKDRGYDINIDVPESRSSNCSS